MPETPGVPRMILKLALDGSVFLDGRATSLDEMDARIRDLVQRNGVLIYYREALTTEGSPAAESVFKRIVALRPAILLGSKAPPEWGRLKWLEVEEAPARSRVFVARGEKFLVSVPSEAGGKPSVYTGGPLTPAAEDRVLGSLDLMVRADRVVESPLHEPESAFNPELQRAPSLHVRIAYESGRAWASYYPDAEIPGNLRSFVADAHGVGREIIAAVERVRGSRKD